MSVHRAFWIDAIYIELTKLNRENWNSHVMCLGKNGVHLDVRWHHYCKSIANFITLIEWILEQIYFEHTIHTNRKCPQWINKSLNWLFNPKALTERNERRNKTIIKRAAYTHARTHTNGTQTVPFNLNFIDQRRERKKPYTHRLRLCECVTDCLCLWMLVYMCGCNGCQKAVSCSGCRRRRRRRIG